MAITLTVTDNADGTGGVATIGGTSVGASNQVYYSAYTGAIQSYSWTLAGTRTGDGTLNLALATGHYLFQLVSAGSLGPAYRQAFSTGTDPVHKRILDAIVVRVLETGVLASGRVVLKWLPRDTDPELAYLPLIYVCPVGSEEFPGGTNTQDDILYPSVVCYIAKQNHDSVANLSAVTGFREKVISAFIKQRLAGINWDCDIKPDLVFNPGMFLKNYLSSSIGISFKVRRPRGLI